MFCLHLSESTETPGKFYALFGNMLDEIPQDEVVTLFFEKMETSSDFSEMLDYVGSQDFKHMLNVLRVSKFYL